jgi:mannose/fructose/N-acetylgalactosamine-specific phosphotransferase system component IID
MREIISLLSTYLVGGLNPFNKPQSLISMRLVANLGAVFLLVFGYVLGSRALYHYLEPQFGEVISLLALCGLLVITSLLLFMIGWCLKPKDPPIKEFIANIEDAISKVPDNEIVKKIMAQVSPKSIAAVCAVVIVTTLLSKSKKII